MEHTKIAADELSYRPRQPPAITIRVLGKMLRMLARMGLHIKPFLVVREGEDRDDDMAELTDFVHGFVDSSEIPELVRLQPGTDPEKLRRWFGAGRLCFGVWDGPRLIAKMWCDLDEFNFPPNRRMLNPREAYLFAAYTDPAYRGRGLAPAMRVACYRALHEKGRSVFYSYTDFCNIPARRFKKKLGALDEALRVHMRLGKGRGKTLTLRTFNCRV